MAGKSSVVAGEGKRPGLRGLSRSRDRGEADRARAILLTLLGWTSGQIAQAFGVREDTVRVWRSAFMTGGLEALKTSVAPGPTPPQKRRARAGANSRQSGAGVGRGRGGPVRACSGSSELDAAPSGRRDRDARGRAHLP